MKWDGSADPEFTVEVQEADGTWTDAYAAEPLDGSPDTGTAEAEQVAARRGAQHITEPISVLDVDRVRIRMHEGLATNVELVTIGGDAPMPTDDTTPPSSTAPGTAPPSAPESSSTTAAAQASVLTWSGAALVTVGVAGFLLLRRRRDGRARHHRALLGLLVVVLAIAASGCVGGGGGRATSPAGYPGVKPRSAWGGPGSTPCSGYADGVHFAVVHHTGGGPQDNNYTDAASKIHGIYAYHLSSGYCDIAYNFVVDKYGVIWEGRAGGIDKPVIGAHALNFNTGSTGVVILGDFTSQTAPAAAQNAVVKILAWKFQIHHVIPVGTLNWNGRTIGKINGHRDVNQTSCPGDAFYPHLGEVRAAVASRVWYGDPVGSFDYAQRDGAGNVRIVGWAVDPDTYDPISIRVDIGSETYVVPADLPRQDIADRYPGYGPNHGFDTLLPVPDDPVDVCVTLVNVRYGNHVFLHCKHV